MVEWADRMPSNKVGNTKEGACLGKKVIILFGFLAGGGWLLSFDTSKVEGNRAVLGTDLGRRERQRECWGLVPYSWWLAYRWINSE